MWASLDDLTVPVKRAWISFLAAGAFSFFPAVQVQAQTQPSSSEAPVQVQKFSLKKVQIQGNTLLPDDTLTALVSQLAGNDRTLGDLMQAAAAVQQAYREAGYGGVIAFVPEQELGSGNIIIRVVEGKLATVEISDNKRYSDANIIASLPHLKIGETPRVRAIDRDIQLINENPAKEVRVTLAAG